MSSPSEASDRPAIPNPPHSIDIPRSPSPTRVFLSFPSHSPTTRMPFLAPPFLTLNSPSTSNPLLNPINVLLLFIPLGIVAGALGVASDAVVFFLNFLAIVPLAPLMSWAKRELANGLGGGVGRRVGGGVWGGLLVVGLGNGVLWIVAIIAVSRGQILIVQSSLVGSILFESLLILGSSIFFASYGRENVQFHNTLTNIMSSLMMVASVCLIVPTAMSPSLEPSDDTSEGDMGRNILIISRSTAIILLALFFAYLYFQLNTHAFLFLDPLDNEGTANGESGNSSVAEVEQRRALGHWAALGVLITTIICTIWCAYYLVNSIDGLAKSLNIGKTFIGLVLIPTMGNIAKFATSMEKKMDYMIRTIIGSVLQITLLVAPFLVLLGWFIEQPMILSFDVFEAAVFLLAIMVVTYIIQDGKTNYFEGFMLMGTYIIIVAAFYIRPDPAENVVGLGLQNLERSESIELH